MDNIKYKRCNCGKYVRSQLFKDEPSEKVIRYETIGWAEHKSITHFHKAQSHPDGLCESCNYQRVNPKEY